MDKICYIKQPAGLGDILFCQKIAYRAIHDFGCKKVIWPISHVYSYLPEYVSNIDKNVILTNEQISLNFPNQLINNEEILYIPLQSCDNLVSHHDSRANGHIKYKFFFDTVWDDWKNYFIINRNIEREKKLIYDLSININEPYNFINPNYGTPPNYITNINIKPNNEYKNVYMSILPNTNIFDWLTIIENAKEIHTMETSLYYLLEKLSLNENVFIYSKYKHINPNSVDDYEYMRPHCSKKWNYV